MRHVFHARCGDNIKISSDCKQAKRDGNTYDYGMTFSSKCILPGETVLLKIDEVEQKWAGSLRLGITTLSPDVSDRSILRAVTDIFGNEELSRKYWIVSGGNIHHNSSEKTIQTNLHQLEFNSVVGLRLSTDGKLYIFQDQLEHELIAQDLPIKENLYVIVDIYGRTKAVSWHSREVESLQVLCRDEVLKNVKTEDIDDLNVPRILKRFLKFQDYF